ncbi:MAG TPA: hypothetical protein VMU30_00445 [Bacteroidota bacterium]|nr:hypothetical protein [Bacteroidota bacterium]
MKRLNNSLTLVQHSSNVLSVILYQIKGVILTVFFRSQQYEPSESFAFGLIERCLETDEESEPKERQLSKKEFMLALVGVVLIVAVVRGVVWLVGGC